MLGLHYRQPYFSMTMFQNLASQKTSSVDSGQTIGPVCSVSTLLALSQYLVLDKRVFLWLQDRVYSFHDNPKNLDPSYKMDLEYLGLFRKGKTHIIAKFHKTD